MTWSWNTRGALPNNTIVGTGGGGVGSVEEARTAHAWPQYEAEYLKRALQSASKNYDASGLPESEKAIYLERA